MNLLEVLRSTMYTWYVGIGILEQVEVPSQQDYVTVFLVVEDLEVVVIVGIAV